MVSVSFGLDLEVVASPDKEYPTSKSEAKRYSVSRLGRQQYTKSDDAGKTVHTQQYSTGCEVWETEGNYAE
jgi:hypothetical protein